MRLTQQAQRGLEVKEFSHKISRTHSDSTMLKSPAKHHAKKSILEGKMHLIAHFPFVSHVQSMVGDEHEKKIRSC